MNYFLVLSLAVTFVASVFTQQGREETITLTRTVPTEETVARLNRELREQKLIRIVEPVAYPLHRLEGMIYNSERRLEEFILTCGLSGPQNVLKTDSGRAWRHCEPTPPSRVLFEGPNTPESMYGDRTIKVTIQGTDTDECLTWIRNDSFSATSDRLKSCDNGTQVQTPIIARFTVVTKLIRYTKAEEEDSRKFAESVAGRRPIFSNGERLVYQILKAGELKYWEVSVSPVIYEFLDLK